MELEKIKRKIADGYNDEEICNMSGMPAADVAKLRIVKPKPVPTKPVPTKPAPTIKKGG